jgi:hypothetical protein
MEARVGIEIDDGVSEEGGSGAAGLLGFRARFVISICLSQLPAGQIGPLGLVVVVGVLLPS